MSTHLNIDEHFADADEREVMLFKLGLLAWLAAIEAQGQKIFAPDRTIRLHEIDHRDSPVVEINDGAWVRHFSVDARGDVVRYVLSDPIRAVDESVDPTCEDHTRVLFPELSIRARPLPERIVNYVSVLIPRRNREALVGDLYEDIRDWRESGTREKRIAGRVIWHLAIAVIHQLWPLVRRLLLLNRLWGLIR